MRGIEALIAEILERRRDGVARGDILERIAAAWQDVPGAERAPGVARDVMLATMLSVGNTRAAAGLDRFDPSHYDGRRLAKDLPLATRERVSTFGHGRHSCPAQRFSISAIRIAIRRLIEHFALAPRFGEAQPLRRQLGAVARAARPCPVEYRQRD